MFRWSRKRKGSPDRSELIVQARNELDFTRSKWVPQHTAVLAMFLATQWRQFLRGFGSPDGFQKAERDKQIEYLQHLLQEQARRASEVGEFTGEWKTGTSVDSYCAFYAAKFMGYYAVALMENDAEWERELVPPLDELLRYGWGISLGGVPLPGDEQYFSSDDPTKPPITFSRREH